MRIVTPVQYEQFKSGDIGKGYDVVRIESTAHPHILLEPKYFWNASSREIHFSDADGNRIALYPKWQAVLTFLRSGENLTLGIPTNYKDYRIMSVNEAKISLSDLDNILQWKNAIRLDISDRSDVPYLLSQRINELKAMEQLKLISLYIDRNSFQRLCVKPFLVELKSVESVNFLTGSLDENEFQDFVTRQGSLGEKQWKLEIRDRLIIYRKESHQVQHISSNSQVANAWLYERQKTIAEDRLESTFKQGTRSEQPFSWPQAKKFMPDRVHWSSQYSNSFRRMSRSGFGMLWWTLRKFH